ncbi:hypothetical protein [uncultured Tateyamaria sp.]|uniref:hypothetical protein n=1 Tax=Tateyamaria sp. 1078 TaxID=3417464 RepID=UPI00262763C2|nr:hypothetical protein [uncultured Tateyamaria sp.]
MNDYTLMPGKPFEGTEEETLRTIRAVLTEEAAEAKRQRTEIAKAFVDRTIAMVDAPRRRATDLPKLQAPVEPAKPAPQTKRARLTRTLTAPLRAAAQFRPTTRHLAFVSVLLLVVVRPHWFIVAGACIVALVLGLFLFMGAGRIWGTLLHGVELIEKSDVARGTRLRNSLDRFACRWDRLLDMLPDGMADTLYMPDFQQRSAEVEAQHAQAVADRFDRMQRDG